MLLGEGADGACVCGELSVVDERGSSGLQEYGWKNFEQGAMLDLALLPQARADQIKVRAAVPRVADELPCTRGQMLKNLAEHRRCEISGGRDAKGAAGGGDGSVAQVGVCAERGSQLTEKVKLQAASVAAVTESAAPTRLERIAYRANRGAARGFDQRPADGGEEVCVLVGVDVGDRYAGRLKPSDLGQGLGPHVLFADSTRQRRSGKGGERWSEAAAVRADQRRDRLRRRDGDAVNEDDVAADPEGRISLSDGGGIVEGGAAGHEGDGGKYPGAVQFLDRAVDARGETEVIRVDDQPGGQVLRGASGWKIKQRQGKLVGSEGLEPPTSCL